MDFAHLEFNNSSNQSIFMTSSNAIILSYTIQTQFCPNGCCGASQCLNLPKMKETESNMILVLHFGENLDFILQQHGSDVDEKWLCRLHVHYIVTCGFVLIDIHVVVLSKHSIIFFKNVCCVIILYLIEMYHIVNSPSVNHPLTLNSYYWLMPCFYGLVLPILS